MSGHYSNRCGTWHTIKGRSMLFQGEITLEEVFQKNGYATAMFGKWHLGDNYPFRPEDRGFSEVVRHGGGALVKPLIFGIMHILTIPTFIMVLRNLIKDFVRMYISMKPSVLFVKILLLKNLSLCIFQRMLRIHLFIVQKSTGNLILSFPRDMVEIS